MLKKKILVILSSLTLFVCLTTTSVLANPMVPSNSNVSNEILQQNVNSRLAGAQSFDVPISSYWGSGDENGGSAAADQVVCEYPNVGVKLRINQLTTMDNNYINSLKANEKVVIAIYNGINRVFYKEVYGASINTVYSFPEFKVQTGSRLRAYVYLRTNSNDRDVLGQARLVLYCY